MKLQCMIILLLTSSVLYNCSLKKNDDAPSPEASPQPSTPPASDATTSRASDAPTSPTANEPVATFVNPINLIPESTQYAQTLDLYQGARFLTSADRDKHAWINVIGRLMPDTDSTCTAQLVGTNTILTAYHCITDRAKTDGTYDLNNLYFERSLLDGVSLEKVSVIDVKAAGLDLKKITTQKKYTNTNDLQVDLYGLNISGIDDWALLILSKNIGEKAGYFEVFDSDSALKTSDIADLKAAGYATIRDYNKLSLVEGCKVNKGYASVLKISDCMRFDGQGMSGGALFKNLGSISSPKWMLIGSVRGGKQESNGSWTNSFVSGSTIAAALK